MGRRWRSKEKESHTEGDNAAGEGIIFISSDDEEANKDLSLEIVNKSRLRELKRKRDEDKEKARVFFHDLSTSSADETAVIPNGTATGMAEVLASEAGEEVKKKRKKKSKKKKRKDVEKETVTETPCAPIEEVEPIVPTDSVIEVVNEASNNPVLRKLLRGPRYFDSVHESCESCYNCGVEGHIAANCKEERRQKPCFVCGMFGHIAKNCIQGQDCFICKRKGHHAKDCQHKHENNSQESIICLRCGDLGHDMASCRNNYASCDIKEIQCYVCKKYGHLCCVEYADSGPNQISCYNCAESGHFGQGCAKQRGESNPSTPSTVCYSCGQEGHFARGCTNGRKLAKRYGESSAPVGWANGKMDVEVSKISKFLIKRHGESSTTVSGSKDKKHKKDPKVSKSLPKNYERNHPKERPYFDGISRPVKSKVKGGWIVDDTINLPKRKHKTNYWASPVTPSGRGNQNHSQFVGGGYPSSHTPSRTYNVHVQSSGNRYSTPYTHHQRDNYYARTPNSHGFSGGYHHGYSASRLHNFYDYYG